MNMKLKYQKKNQTFIDTVKKINEEIASSGIQIIDNYSEHISDSAVKK